MAREYKIKETESGIEIIWGKEKGGGNIIWGQDEEVATEDQQLKSKQERMLDLEKENPDLEIGEKGAHGLTTAPIDLDGDGKADIKSIELGEEPEGSQEQTIKSLPEQIEEEGLESIEQKIKELQDKYKKMLKEKE